MTTETTEEFIERTRREEAAVERMFPGYPGYVSPAVLRKIERGVEHSTDELMDIMRQSFGYAGVNAIGAERLKQWVGEILSDLARSTTHQAAGHMAIRAAHQADEASHNMLTACLTGIALGSKTEEEETEDAGTEN